MRTAIALCMTLAVAPALAESPPKPAPEMEEGFSLMREGAGIFMRSLMQEMRPALEELQGQMAGAAAEMEPALRRLAEEMGPALTDLLGKVDEIGNYQAPEFLPNGDIILRRRPDAPPWAPPADDSADPAGPHDI